VADHHHLLAHDLLDPHALGRDLAIDGLVGPQRKQRGVLVRRGDGGRRKGGVHGFDRSKI
jgi:hypothetical protein